MDQDAGKSLPTIETDLSVEQIRSRLLTLSKKGRLAGYEGQERDGFASVAAHGAPFDSRLHLHHRDGSIRFSLRMLPTMPWIFAILLIVTIWPGIILTDDFLASFEWYEHFVARTGIQTWWWYLPLTVIPAPFAFRSAIRKSRASAAESSLETIEKIGEALSGG